MRPILDWASAGQALAGEPESGDRSVVALLGSRALIGVIDGMGHGPEAAAASGAAAEVLERHAGEPLGTLFRLCHDRLLSTRGAAMTLAAFDAEARTLDWLGVGNVAIVLARREPSPVGQCKPLLVRSGIVGLRLPALDVSRLDIGAGDVVVLATDGIDAGFAEAATADEEPRDQAERLLASWCSGTDDALLLVARFDGA
jgi:negative regulator of sigma-B (phosphoserine phosphatase)